MRILLAAMFLAPIVGYAAFQSGSHSVTPAMISLVLVAICGQILIERRQRGA